MKDSLNKENITDKANSLGQMDIVHMENTKTVSVFKNK
jgi:hypothetical protein